MSSTSNQDIPQDYSGRLLQLRKKLKLTQTRLAELLGVSFASINRWENGQSRPNALAWQKIALAEQHGLAALTPSLFVAASDGKPNPFPAPIERNPFDFLASPEQVKAVVEGERLEQGFLYNPTFATETARIAALPHQQLAVYEHMLKQLRERARLRFLLADDAGAGKTIMTGLLVREMLMRHWLRRILIVTPAGLVGNWHHELQHLFGLDFHIVNGSEARTSNPFVGPNSNLLIVSVDTLAGRTMFSRLREPDVLPYDLAVFDEAHKLAVSQDQGSLRVRKTDRYQLAETLAGVSDQPANAQASPDGNDGRLWRLPWSCRHLLLLTATPHMGDSYAYYGLWRLLEPEVLSTQKAFENYPASARRAHFLRRTKEEMVRYDGKPLYPVRISDTLSYDLVDGPVSEQALYDATTDYIQDYYALAARRTNRSAAGLAMSIFQRRLASSTYALLRSFERRADKLQALLETWDAERLSRIQTRLNEALKKSGQDGLDSEFGKTADEEESQDGRENNEVMEDRALQATTALSREELAKELTQVLELRDLARKVHDSGQESKFLKLDAVLSDPDRQGQKMLIFTEHRDTLEFLVRRLEGRGFAGQVARIHGGMGYQEREQQIAFFRKPVSEGGAAYLVGTDAAGEGINLQFCSLMVNYDIPWNPARLEQRMGRIHRYGQKASEVIIVNLVAGKTREGRVMEALLRKLENIRRELTSDKVFDVVGRIFEGKDFKDYLQEIGLNKNADTHVLQAIDTRLSAGTVQQFEADEQARYGETGGGEVARRLPELRKQRERQAFLQLLPGYVRQFLRTTLPLLNLHVEGDLEKVFSLQAAQPGALDPLWAALDKYPPEQHQRLTIHQPDAPDGSVEDAIALYPGEPVFESIRSLLRHRYGDAACRGAIFADPLAAKPYLYHLALITVRRLADPPQPGLEHGQVLEYKLVGMKQEAGGLLEECPPELLLLLGSGPAPDTANLPSDARFLLASASASRDEAEAYARTHVARELAESCRKAFMQDAPEREQFLKRGFGYEEAELAGRRSKLRERADKGDAYAKHEIERIRQRQRELDARRSAALNALRREPELITPGHVEFLAHALVVPSADPDTLEHFNRDVEWKAVEIALAHERAAGADVFDVSRPEGALKVGLCPYPGFDLLSRPPAGEERAIEVKGRAQGGDIQLTGNEWARACIMRDRYWLYVVYDCAGSNPRPYRVQDPFGRLIAQETGGVTIREADISEAAEWEAA